MLLLKRLVRPNKRSGYVLPPGKTTTLKAFNVTITNTGKEPVYVDRKTAKPKKRRRK